MSSGVGLALPRTVLGGRLAVQSPPGLEAVRLWLMSDEEDLDARCQEAWHLDRVPMWAFCWASGAALARHLLAHPELVRGRHVVDLGAGSGVTAIAAALAGAASVRAVDPDPDAQRAVRANAALNGVALEVGATLPAELDLVLACDVLYEAEVRALVLSLWERGHELWVADAHRPGTGPLPFAPLAVLEARTFPDVDAPMDRAFLYHLKAR